MGATNGFSIPPLGILNELDEYGLIRKEDNPTQRGTSRLVITLLQELRNAVNSDFDVSDYFVAHVNVTVEMLPDMLINLLGEEMLRQNVGVQQAIEELRTSDKPTRRQKMGKVIEELGRCLGHVSNTVGVTNAIAIIARLFSGGGL